MPARPATQLVYQKETILKHKDRKGQCRKYLVKDVATGSKEWRDVTSFKPDSETVLLYELSIPQLQLEPREGAASAKERAGAKQKVIRAKGN